MFGALGSNVDRDSASQAVGGGTGQTDSNRQQGDGVIAAASRWKPGMLASKRQTGGSSNNNIEFC